MPILILIYWNFKIIVCVRRPLHCFNKLSRHKCTCVRNTNIIKLWSGYQLNVLKNTSTVHFPRRKKIKKSVLTFLEKAIYDKTQNCALKKKYKGISSQEYLCRALFTCTFNKTKYLTFRTEIIWETRERESSCVCTFDDQLILTDPLYIDGQCLYD